MTDQMRNVVPYVAIAILIIVLVGILIYLKISCCDSSRSHNHEIVPIQKGGSCQRSLPVLVTVPSMAESSVVSLYSASGSKGKFASKSQSKSPPRFCPKEQSKSLKMSEHQLRDMTAKISSPQL